ncbi:hypothetical protein [Flavobacterium anhuiense]|uniref:hypothetical protein n=1 Tax=Flavobacterium anhuiense TaxID=459526 RepID=UPI003D98E4D9
MNIYELVSQVRREYTEFEYDKLLVDYIFTLQGSYSFIVNYEKDGELKESEQSNKAIRDEVRKMTGKFEKYKSSDQKFNRVKIEINNDGAYKHNYWWDNAVEKQDLLDYADVFYQWANDRMMSLIFEYEKENNLIATQYDDDGDLEYLSSWDSGLFTFHINDKGKLEHKIVLTQDGKERILDMPLKDYFVEGILEHHKSTNNELADEWKSWNTMELKSLHSDIPHDKREEFVRYF